MIVINNLKCSIGQKKYGVQFGGDYIIDKFDNSKIRKINHFLFKNQSAYSQSYNQILTELNNNNFCINIGGDHSVGISTIQPVLDKYHDDVLIVWIDAHGDINTPETSPSQNKHGMPVAALLNLMENWIGGQTHHVLNPKNIVYVGIRDLDPGEVNFINQLGIKYFKHFNHQVLEYIDQHRAKHIHISCDIDGIDPQMMPSTGTKASDGLIIDDVLKIIKQSKDRLISFDLVEFNPLIGNQAEQEMTLNNILLILDYLIDSINYYH